MPRDTPRANVIECREVGAHVTLIDGLITDCGAEIARRKEKEGWFDLSTLKEPYRVEGKKTLGYELAEQLGWELPDVILYPTGGGTGSDRNVESVRRNGNDGLDRSEAAAHVFRAGQRLRADRACFRSGRDKRRRISKRSHLCFRAARPQGGRAIFSCSRSCANHRAAP